MVEQKKCQACGVEKDPAVKELYPYSDDAIVTDRPIKPLFQLDCEPDGSDGDYRLVTVCHACLHRLHADMWISEAQWTALNPVVPFVDLPYVPEDV